MIAALPVKIMTLAWAPLRPMSGWLSRSTCRSIRTGKVLRLAYPSLGGLYRRELAAGSLVSLRHPPADAVHRAAIEAPRHYVQGDQYFLPRLYVAELVLAHIGRNPARTALEKTEQRLARADVLSAGKPQIGDDSVRRSHHLGIAQIEPGLVERRQRLADFGITHSRGAEVCFGPPQIGLRARQVRPRHGNILVRTDALRLGEGLLADEIGDDRIELAAGGKIRPLLLDLRFRR